MKNLKQAGSTTRIAAVQPDTGTAIPPSTFAFTFEQDEGGYCQPLRAPLPARQRGDRLHAVPREAAGRPTTTVSTRPGHVVSRPRTSRSPHAEEPMSQRSADPPSCWPARGGLLEATPAGSGPRPSRPDVAAGRDAACPSALLSMTARRRRTSYAVGSDKGHGPLVLHFDGAGAGSSSRRARTGTSGGCTRSPTGAR